MCLSKSSVSSLIPFILTRHPTIYLYYQSHVLDKSVKPTGQIVDQIAGPTENIGGMLYKHILNDKDYSRIFST